MRRFPRALVVAVLISVLGTVALAGMATGASASVPSKAKPAAWAKTVCGSLGTWLDKLDSAAAQATATPPTTPAEGKKALVKLVGTALGATKKLVVSLKKAGPPAVEGGGDVSSIVIDQFKQVTRTLSSAKQDLKALPSDDGPGFVAASRIAEDELESGLEHVQAAFNAASVLDVAPFVAAFNAEPSCAALTA
jgi:hypothetical protein